ncbi:type IV pilus biogenesis protein PilM [Prochlorococcus marinus]|uniref:Pilus assembly protein PilM n=1 Tax=Prochlorococcus marinus XMU1408 TaxID=2213228 RepID=A0A318QY58_PROMR|nr:pilus assembly protein PilM [Prochlorococcus marinus]PYE01074.1 hypothetical protein DNJ73_06475 [Prochlorococcus marinus XMU1408]
MVQTPSSNNKILGLDISNIKKYLTDVRRNISKRYLLLEFNEDSLIYGELRIKNDQIYVNKLNSINIGVDAIERGTPVDTDLMSSFIKEIIDEENIWAHRIGIVLPPQAAFCKVIHLPSNLNSDQARDFVVNSKSGFQFPIPLNQTDYDLIPINDFNSTNKANVQSYFLSSIPQKLIDNIIETLNKADLELSFLGLSFSALENLACSSINKLQSNQMILIIELCNECSHFYLYNKFGLVQVNTVAAIRAFPNPQENNIDSGISIEQNIINSDEYLPISELDIKTLIKEIKHILSKLNMTNPNFKILEVLLSGRNSSYPNIAKLFQSTLEIKTSILRPINNELVEEIETSKPIISQDLGRIIGIGLNPLISDQPQTNKEKNNKKESLDSEFIKNNKAYLEFQSSQPEIEIIDSDSLIKDNKNLIIEEPISSRNKLDKINDLTKEVNLNLEEENEVKPIDNIKRNELIEENIKTNKEDKVEDETKELNFNLEEENEVKPIDNIKRNQLIEENIKTNKEDKVEDETKELNFNLEEENEVKSIDNIKRNELIEENIKTNKEDKIVVENEVSDLNYFEDNEDQLIKKVNTVDDLQTNNNENKNEVDFEMPNI